MAHLSDGSPSANRHFVCPGQAGRMLIHLGACFSHWRGAGNMARPVMALPAETVVDRMLTALTVWTGVSPRPGDSHFSVLTIRERLDHGAFPLPLSHGIHRRTRTPLISWAQWDLLSVRDAILRHPRPWHACWPGGTTTGRVIERFPARRGCGPAATHLYLERGAPSPWSGSHCRRPLSVP
jgi:hypothetical protein